MGNQTSKKVIVNKELFLTYEGMLRVLFVSKNGKTRRFIKWATETLFTVQMGTIEQKNKIISSIKGVYHYLGLCLPCSNHLGCCDFVDLVVVLEKQVFH